MSGQCPFVGCGCTGGMEAPGYSGCGYKTEPGARCAQLDETPEGMQPRDWYIAQLMELATKN